MKRWQGAAFVVAVGAAGLFAWDRLSGSSGEDQKRDVGEPVALSADEVAARKQLSASRRRLIARTLRLMDVPLDDAGRERLTDVLNDFQDHRLSFWDRDPGTAPGYETRYRAFVGPYVEQVEALLPDPDHAGPIVQRFVWDGRIVKRPPTPESAGGRVGASKR